MLSIGTAYSSKQNRYYQERVWTMRFRSDPPECNLERLYCLASINKLSEYLIFFWDGLSLHPVVRVLCYNSKICVIKPLYRALQLKYTGRGTNIGFLILSSLQIGIELWSDSC